MCNQKLYWIVAYGRDLMKLRTILISSLLYSLDKKLIEKNKETFSINFLMIAHVRVNYRSMVDRSFDDRLFVNRLFTGRPFVGWLFSDWLFAGWFRDWSDILDVECISQQVLPGTHCLLQKKPLGRAMTMEHPPSAWYSLLTPIVPKGCSLVWRVCDETWTGKELGLDGRIGNISQRSLLWSSRFRFVCFA